MRITGMEVVPVAHREPPLRSSWGAHSELAARTVLRLTTADGEGVAETYGDAETEVERSDWLPKEPRW